MASPDLLFVFHPMYADDSLLNLRDQLTFRVVEVAIINDEQLVIKRKEKHLIEIIAVISTPIENLRERLNDSSLTICSIDGSQKVVKRSGTNIIEILSDIVSIEETPKDTNEATTPNQPNAPNCASNSEKCDDSAAGSKANLSSSSLNVPILVENESRRYFICIFFYKLCILIVFFFYKLVVQPNCKTHFNHTWRYVTTANASYLKQMP